MTRSQGELNAEFWLKLILAKELAFSWHMHDQLTGFRTWHGLTLGCFPWAYEKIGSILRSLRGG